MAGKQPIKLKFCPKCFSEHAVGAICSRRASRPDKAVVARKVSAHGGMVDAGDLKSPGEARGGSIPSAPTTIADSPIIVQSRLHEADVAGTVDVTGMKLEHLVIPLLSKADQRREYLKLKARERRARQKAAKK